MLLSDKVTINTIGLPRTDLTNIWHLLGANFRPCVHIQTLTQTHTPACMQAHKVADVCVGTLLSYLFYRPA